MPGRTFAQQFNSMRQSDTYDDTFSLGITLETAQTTLENDLNALRSTRRHDLDPVGLTLNWYDPIPTVNGKQRGNLQLNTDLDSLEEKIGPCYVNFANAIPVPGGQNYAVLSVAGLQTPSTAGTIVKTAEGVAVALGALSGVGFGAHELVEIAGPDALHPINLLELRDQATGNRPQAVDGRDIFGLLQAESTYVDGQLPDDVSGGNRWKISFIKMTATFDDFEAATVADIAGKTVFYNYIELRKFVNSDIGCFVGNRAFVDLAGQVDVTLDRAIDNQGTTPATQTTNINVRIDDGVGWNFQDPTGATNIFRVEANTQDSVTVNGDVDVNNVNTADFAQGASFDTADQAISIGATAGEISSAAAMSLLTTAGDLTLQAGNELLLDDTYRAGSTYSIAMRLADSSQEWTDFEANMAVLTGGSGEVSLLQAYNLLYNASQTAQAPPVVQAEVLGVGTIAPGTNITGVGGGANLDTQLPDYSSGTPANNFVNFFQVYYNGDHVSRGALQTDGTDIYVGDVPANGDIKFNDRIKAGDQIAVYYWGP